MRFEFQFLSSEFCFGCSRTGLYFFFFLFWKFGREHKRAQEHESDGSTFHNCHAITRRSSNCSVREGNIHTQTASQQQHHSNSAISAHDHPSSTIHTDSNLSSYSALLHLHPNLILTGIENFPSLHHTLTPSSSPSSPSTAFPIIRLAHSFCFLQQHTT